MRRSKRAGARRSDFSGIEHQPAEAVVLHGRPPSEFSTLTGFSTVGFGGEIVLLP